MDPESSKGKVGKHQDLEQRDRQRPQRTEKRTTQPGTDVERGPSKTLQDAIDGFLDSKRSLKELTLTNYRRQLQNQVTDVINYKDRFRQNSKPKTDLEFFKHIIAYN